MCNDFVYQLDRYSSLAKKVLEKDPVCSFVITHKNISYFFSTNSNKWVLVYDAANS